MIVIMTLLFISGQSAISLAGTQGAIDSKTLPSSPDGVRKLAVKRQPKALVPVPDVSGCAKLSVNTAVGIPGIATQNKDLIVESDGNFVTIHWDGNRYQRPLEKMKRDLSGRNIVIYDGSKIVTVLFAERSEGIDRILSLTECHTTAKGTVSETKYYFDSAARVVEVVYRYTQKSGNRIVDSTENVTLYQYAEQDVTAQGVIEYGQNLMRYSSPDCYARCTLFLNSQKATFSAVPTSALYSRMAELRRAGKDFGQLAHEIERASSQKNAYLYSESNWTSPDYIVSFKKERIGRLTWSPSRLYDRISGRYYDVSGNDLFFVRDQHYWVENYSNRKIDVIKTVSINLEGKRFQLARLFSGLYRVIGHGYNFVSDGVRTFQGDGYRYSQINLSPQAKYLIIHQLITDHLEIRKVYNVSAGERLLEIARLQGGVYCVTDTGGNQYFSNPEGKFQLDGKKYQVLADSQVAVPTIRLISRENIKLQSSGA
ncbi:MAG: hypothetical protein PHS88_05070 [Candidatus Omnitrophica bacterium]|nr:hypothetical protein [Candidatus Omnitrophota bacterium]